VAARFLNSARAKWIELTILNRVDEIGRAQDALERFTAQSGCSGRTLHQVQLALEEHLTNILNYAFVDQAEHRVTIRAQLEANRLDIEIVDDGRPFNPLEYAAPDLSAPIEKRPLGGLGIYMLRKSVDSVEYRREGNRNILALSKQL
jgi:anti-sigma regulatory factor (Ser/Thr protein kinase)